MNFNEYFNPYIIWGVVAVIFLILELITVGFYAGFYVLSAMVAILANYIGCSIIIQILIFIILANIGFFIFYKYKDKLKITTKTMTPTNFDRIIGAEGEVIAYLDWLPNGGQVRVNAQIWTAISEDDDKLNIGQRVKVIKFDGVKIIVKK